MMITRLKKTLLPCIVLAVCLAWGYRGCESATEETGSTTLPTNGAPLAPDTPYHATGGHGTSTEGGLGGQVLRVTTLAADGIGSLRAALETAGARLVVFDVGGVINLDGETIAIREPFVTVAGQTAPRPGITIIRGELQVTTHDVVIQHLAVRPGDAERSIGWEPDALGVSGGLSHPAYNVVIDHCSATWAVDENLSVSGPRDVTVGGNPHVTSHDVTLYRCIIAEGLSHSTHSRGEHSKGTLIHDAVYNVSIIGCLYAHNSKRSPRLKGGSRAALINNLMYNWGSTCVAMGTKGNDVFLTSARAAIVGNVAVSGPNTTEAVFVRNVDTGADAFLLDNLVRDRGGHELALVSPGITELDNPPFWPDGLVPSESRTSAREVLCAAGARATERDPIDQRIVDAVIRGTGAIIDSQQQVGGYPAYAETRRTLPVPESKDERRNWLDSLSAEIGEARDLDTAAFEALLQ